MRRGNPGVLRLIPDDDSHTGMSAAILLRNVRPVKIKTGTLIARSSFMSNFQVNCEGFRVRPKVTAIIECQLTDAQIKAARKKLILDRCMAGSPMLK